MMQPIQPGQILLDKYGVERVLGAGGMGVVVAARHLALDELVAIKFMLGGGSPADLARFVREARAAVRLKSQHVARVLDVAALEDGTPYMVLEHLDGNDLAHVLKERGPLPVGEAVDLILQASEAIAEAHSIGIIHRDIKPANLFLTRGLDGAPNVKVLDFGIAKWTNAGTAKMDPSQPMGSAPYMALEQFASTNLVDPRTDVWALGATLFHLLTGKTPFHYDDVDSIQAMMHTIMFREPLRPRALRPELSEAMENILLRCLEKEQSERFPSVAALAAVLAPFGSDHAVLYSKRVAKVLGEPEPSAYVATSSEARTAPLPQLVDATAPLPQPAAATAPLPQLAEALAEPATPRKQRGVAVVALVVAVLLVLGGVFVGSRIGREPETSSVTMTPETKAPAALEKPSESAAGATSTAPSSAMNLPAHVEPAIVSTSQSVPSPALPPSFQPRRAAVASPAATPSSTPPPSKESLYGRRR